jgi:pimeloyl-ACP methyl ester carboxylesterase
MTTADGVRRQEAAAMTIMEPDRSPMARSSTENAAIRPFRVDVAEADIDDLRRRLHATRWPEQETVADQSQGPRLATMQALVRHWANDYEFRRFETRLNAVPQFLTEIDGLDIHFIHVKSRHPNALPVIITHGWPGSIIEMLNVIGPLTDPTAHGGTAEDAFDVVVPSMPGYGLSAKPASQGWDPIHIADAWITLMRRLGYTHYVAQGGDWGAQITDVIGAKAPPELLGIHSNMPGTVPPDISKALTSNVFGTGYPAPTGLSADEQRAYDRLSFLFTKGVGYAVEMANRPQTMYGLADSPVALAAWMLDHDAYSLEDISKAFEGRPLGNLTRDEVLDNLTMTWLTNTGVSSGRLYAENTLGFFDVKDVKVPAAVTVFPRELYQAPRSWTEQAYPNLMYFNEVDRGNHFAAWQEPQLFSEELRNAFRSLRSAR